MEFINNLKYKYGLYRLRKDFRKPENNAIVCNLRDVKSLGILFNATKEEDFIIVRDFVHKWRKFIPQIIVLGFVDQKELSNYHIQPLEYKFFCYKDLNWYFKPNEDSVKDFVQKEFDILMDLNLTENLSVRFVVAESVALFKTGRYCEIEPNYYDLMINVQDKKPLDESYNDEEPFEEINPLRELLNQTEYYLKMLKTTKD